jgi:hypothetical protein
MAEKTIADARGHHEGECVRITYIDQGQTSEGVYSLT